MTRFKYLIYIGVAIALLIAILLLRSCFTSPADHSYRILRYTGWYPSNMPGKQSRFFAFTSELIQEAFRSYGFQIQISNLNTDSDKMFDILDSGRTDAVMAPSLPNSVTVQEYYFSTPFYRTGPVLIVPASSSVSSVKDLNGKVVDVKRGDPIVLDLASYGLIFSPYDNAIAALNDLLNGKVDGIIMPVIEAEVSIEAFFPGKFKIATSPLNDEGVRLIAPHTSKGKQLIDGFNKELEKMKQDGRYKVLLEKWGMQ